MARPAPRRMLTPRSEEHTSELQSRPQLVCRLLLEKKTPTLGDIGFRLIHPPPAIAPEPLQRPEAVLVGHASRAFDPVAEIDVGEVRARGSDDVVEDNAGAEALSRFRTDVEEAVDNRQPVALLIFFF